MPRVGNQNVDSDSRLHEGVRFHHPQVNLGRPSNPTTSITITSASWRRYTETKRHLFRQTKKATFSRSEKEPSKVIRCPACCSARSFNPHWRTKFNDDKSKKEWVFTWATTITTASQTWDSPTTWSCSQHPKNRYRKCCGNSRKLLKKWDSGFIQTRRRFSITRAPSTRTQKSNLKLMTSKIEILTSNESVKYSGQKISFYQQETTEIKSRIRAAWATFHKYRQELTSKNYMLKHSLRLLDATVSPAVCYAAGTWAPNKEHERMIQSTQRKMPRLIIQTKRKYKKLRNEILGPKKKLKNLTSVKCVALMTKAVTVKAQRLTMTWTVKFNLKTMPTMRWTPHWLKKETGLNT